MGCSLRAHPPTGRRHLRIVREDRIDIGADVLYSKFGRRHRPQSVIVAIVEKKTGRGRGAHSEVIGAHWNFIIASQEPTRG